MVVAMIESQTGLDAVEDIAAVDGLDMILVGANDLSVGLGIAGQMDHPKVHDAYLRVIKACQANGVSVGIGGLGGWPDLIRQYLELGAGYVSTGNDITFLSAAAAKTSAVRLVGHVTEQGHMKICIYGAGAVGGHIAGRLAGSEAEVSLIARGEQLAAIQQHGLRVETRDGTLLSHPVATDRPADLGPQDIVIVAVKAPALPAIAEDIASLLHRRQPGAVRHERHPLVVLPRPRRSPGRHPVCGGWIPRERYGTTSARNAP